ncbi:MAG: hypothetical protein HUU03_09930 [Planctomycetaceae bacterium]|nr:hypothetical protein [Planctomycetota bacterium]NUO16747.1 hypothetical protein [Planctomycetaceae bacterium]GIK52787.1 MAG: hypothetical protein BroJett014_17600 [Planctomycetota bacterium]HRJ78797.1 hypothetical protein [Planctomycetota bacterium]
MAALPNIPGLMRMLDARDRYVCLAGDEYDHKFDARRRPTWRRALAAWEWMQTRIARPRGRGYWFWGRSREELEPFLRSVFMPQQAQAMLTSGLYVHTFREGKRLNHVNHDLITLDTLPERFEDKAPVVALYPGPAAFDTLAARLDRSHQVLWLPWLESEMHELIVTYDMAEFRLE